MEALIIFGARASSLLSVALGQTFASRHNDDRKVIAFSDNVQDAAHRAGFIAARTWPNNVRAAIAQVVEENRRHASRPRRRDGAFEPLSALFCKENRQESGRVDDHFGRPRSL